MTLLAVAYDIGTGPAEIAAAGRACGVDVLLVVDSAGEHVAGLLPALRGRFDLCDVAGLTPAQAVAAVAAHRPDGIVTFSDPCLRFAAELAEGCGLDHWHGVGVTEGLTDKLVQRRRLAAAGVDATPCAELTSVADLPAALATTGLPAVLKPRGGCGGRDVRRVDDVAAARAAVREFFARPGDATMVAEGLLTGDPDVAGPRWGDYVSVEAVLCHGDYRTLCVTGKFPLAPPFREQGFFLPATLDEDRAAEVRACAERAVLALGVRDGIVHTELKLTRDGPKVLEVNGRVGGYVANLLHRSAGVDVVELAVRIALGQRPEVPELGHDGVTFQYLLVAPQLVGTLRAVEGVDDIRALPGVDVIQIQKRRGDRVDWRDGEPGRLGAVYGQAPDHEALAGLTDRIRRAFRPSFEEGVLDVAA
jgi:biotin carboxylase